MPNEKNFCNDKRYFLDGNFFQTPNAVSEALCRFVFSGRDYLILELIKRESWGWQKPTCLLDIPAQSANLGLWPSQMEEAIASLVAGGVLYREGEHIGIQLDVAAWTLPERKKRNRKRSFAKTANVHLQNEETANVHLQNTEPEAENIKRSFANEVPESANDADLAELKNTTNGSVKNMTPPMAPPKRRHPMVALVEDAPWGEGERERFFDAIERPGLEALNLPLGFKLEANIKDFLAFPVEMRAKAWAYVDGARAEGRTINNLFPYLVGYLKDSSSYPPLKPKLVDASERFGADEKVRWLFNDAVGRFPIPRFESEWGYALERLVPMIARRGVPITREEVKDRLASASHPREVAHWMVDQIAAVARQQQAK